MDDIDKKILRKLQENARVTISELSSEIALSMPAISERLKKLENSGVIRQYAAILDPMKLNKHLMALIFLLLLEQVARPYRMAQSLRLCGITTAVFMAIALRLPMPMEQ